MGLLEALGIFLGFDFCPHLIIPVTEIRKTPSPGHGFRPCYAITNLEIEALYADNVSVKKKLFEFENQREMKKGYDKWTENFQYRSPFLETPNNFPGQKTILGAQHPPIAIHFLLILKVTKISSLPVISWSKSLSVRQ